jgi:ABC-2 type transport system ATP-binding protein
VREFITDLREEGRTLLICTHNLNEADRLCDRIAVFDSTLLALDTPTNLRKQLFGRTVVFHLVKGEEKYANTIESKDFVQSAKIIDNKLVVTLDDPEAFNPEIVRILVDKGADIRFVGELRRSLEEVYLHLVKNNEEKVS